MKVYYLLVLGFVVNSIGCSGPTPAQSISGVKLATVGEVKLNTEGHTIEQQNIIDRIKTDNDPGALKHLYVISPFSGQVILYSPVRGKVTSSGKRLNPKNIRKVYDSSSLPTIKVGGSTFEVDELANEDGTYGAPTTSIIFWTTPNGIAHEHFLGGGQIVHVSDQPLSVKNVIITIDK